jgi:hypothetical protein
MDLSKLPIIHETLNMPKKKAALYVVGIVALTALITYHLSKNVFTIKFSNLKPELKPTK